MTWFKAAGEWVKQAGEEVERQLIATINFDLREARESQVGSFFFQGASFGEVAGQLGSLHGGGFRETAGLQFLVSVHITATEVSDERMSCEVHIYKCLHHLYNYVSSFLMHHSNSPPVLPLNLSPGCPLPDPGRSPQASGASDQLPGGPGCALPPVQGPGGGESGGRR